MVRTVARVAAVAVAGVLLMSGCSASPSPLEGRWQDGYHNVYEFTAAGGGALKGEIVQGSSHVCLPADIHVTGTGNRFTGTEEYHTVVGGKCTAKSAGNGGITLTVGPHSTSVSVLHTPPGGVSCLNCQPEVWTKLPAKATFPWLLIVVVAVVLVLGVLAVWIARRRSRRAGPPPGAAPPVDYAPPPGAEIPG